MSYKNIGIYNIGYITIRNNWWSWKIHSVNPLYLMIGKVIGHIERNSVEAKNESKCLVFTSSNENKEKLKNT